MESKAAPFLQNRRATFNNIVVIVVQKTNLLQFVLCSTILEVLPLGCQSTIILAYNNLHDAEKKSPDENYRANMFSSVYHFIYIFRILKNAPDSIHIIDWWPVLFCDLLRRKIFKISDMTPSKIKLALLVYSSKIKFRKQLLTKILCNNIKTVKAFHLMVVFSSNVCFIKDKTLQCYLH